MEMLKMGFSGPFLLLVHLSSGKGGVEEQGLRPTAQGSSFLWTRGPG